MILSCCTIFRNVSEVANLVHLSNFINLQNDKGYLRGMILLKLQKKNNRKMKREANTDKSLFSVLFLQFLKE